MNGVEQRADAQPIACQEQAPVARVPDSERILPVQKLQTVRAVGLIEVKDYFRIRIGGEAVPDGLQGRPQLDIVEDLAIEDDPQGAVFIRDGLVAPFQIDDAQSGASQANLPVQVEAETVGAAVAHHGEHPAQAGFQRRLLPLQVINTCNAAHRLLLHSALPLNRPVGSGRFCGFSRKWFWAALHKIPHTWGP